MSNIIVYIQENVYKYQSKLFNSYFTTYEREEKNGEKYVVVKLPMNASNILCDLLIQLEPTLYINFSFENSEKHYFWNNIGKFMMDAFKNMDDSCQLIQILYKFYMKRPPTYGYDPSDIHLASLSARDKNVWRYIMVQHTSMLDYSSLLIYVCKLIKNDSNIDVIIAHLKQFDDFIDKHDTQLNTVAKIQLITCLKYSISNNCPKICKILIESKIFSDINISFSVFINAVYSEMFDTADLLLESIKCKDLNIDSVAGSPIWKCSWKSIEYLAEQIAHDKITIQSEKVIPLIERACAEGVNCMFIYIVTIFPTMITRELLEKIRRVCPDDWYAEYMEEIVIENEELMRELEVNG